MIREYDVIVVGAGTAGQTAAYDLKAAGLRVAVVEKSERPGGVCALSGCQSKKWFYEAAETIARCRHLTGKGIVEPPCGSWPQVLREKNKFTSAVPDNTVKGFQQAGIDFIEGKARFQDGDALLVGGNSIRAGFFILAVGAKPMSLSFPGSDLLMTSDQWLEQADLPERLLFVGGGFIAFEFAHFAVRLGPPGCRAIILEAADRPLKPFDAEMVDLLIEASAEAGIEIHAGVQISGIQKTNGAFRVHTGAGTVFEADQVVHGAGRVPAIGDLGLDAAGIAFNRSGVVVDEYMRTSNAKVFAIGDCAATIQLARVADDEGHTAARAILSDLGKGEPEAIRYEAVPSVLFTYPQLGLVGKTEQGLLQDGISYKKSVAKKLGWPTYRRVGLNHAGYKILTDDNGRFLGAHFLSDNACGILNTIRLAMMNGITVDQLYRQSITGPYPSRESDLIYMLKPLLSGSSEA
jgi:glutathione reductase (NADPH)